MPFNFQFLRAVALSALAMALASLAGGSVINITMDAHGVKVADVAMKSIGNNSPSAHYQWLEDVIADYESAYPVDLPDLAGMEQLIHFGSVKAKNIPVLDLTGISYLTFHYGKGKGGIGQGGGVVAYYVTDTSLMYTPHKSGLGPNGLGGLSTIYGWGHAPAVHVPDDVSPALLLGALMGGFALLRRRRR